jgi:hypothetical protein
MDKNRSEIEILLADIDRRIAQAPDEAARAELLNVRERLSSPELQDLLRSTELARFKGVSDNLALEFHDPLLPGPVTATASVIATAVCLFAIVDGFEHPMTHIAGTPVNLWVVAAFAGAFSVLFTALSFMRAFTVHFDVEGMVSRVSGSRWRRLHVGAMRWQEIRSIRERGADRVLEVHAKHGGILEIPMRVVNYPILQQHLENMVRLYGEYAAPGGRPA